MAGFNADRKARGAAGSSPVPLRGQSLRAALTPGSGHSALFFGGALQAGKLLGSDSRG
jgi:hypothetical protein